MATTRSSAGTNPKKEWRRVLIRLGGDGGRERRDVVTIRRTIDEIG